MSTPLLCTLYMLSRLLSQLVYFQPAASCVTSCIGLGGLHATCDLLRCLFASSCT